MVTAEVSEQAPQLIPHTEAKAKVWVANLPITNPGETTKRLFYGLVDLNRRALPVATRIAIGEMLIPAMGVALEALQRHLVARAFPLTAKTQKIFELAQSLTLEFAGLYQVAALDIITKKEGNKNAFDKFKSNLKSSNVSKKSNKEIRSDSDNIWSKLAQQLRA